MFSFTPELFPQNHNSEFFFNNRRISLMSLETSLTFLRKGYEGKQTKEVKVLTVLRQMEQ